MERFFDGTNQENSKKTTRKEWRKEKEENLFFYFRGGSHTHVFSNS
jgi:hypothetical protein